MKCECLEKAKCYRETIQCSTQAELKLRKGVAVVLRNDVVKGFTKVECYSDGLMFVQIRAKPVDFVLLKMYMLTTNHDDDEIEKLYEQISEILHQKGRGQVNAIVMGDFNSIVGKDLQIRW